MLDQPVVFKMEDTGEISTVYSENVNLIISDADVYGYTIMIKNSPVGYIEVGDFEMPATGEHGFTPLIILFVLMMTMAMIIIIKLKNTSEQ